MIILEPFTKHDFNRLISWINNEEELIQFAGSIFKYPLTTDQLENYINNNRRKPFKIKELNSNEIIGHCELNYDEEIPKLSRILIGPKSKRNKGLGNFIVHEMIHKILQDPKVSQISLNVFDWNTNAIKCYEKNGFRAISGHEKTILVGTKTWHTIQMRYYRSGTH